MSRLYTFFAQSIYLLVSCQVHEHRIYRIHSLYNIFYTWPRISMYQIHYTIVQTVVLLSYFRSYVNDVSRGSWRLALQHLRGFVHYLIAFCSDLVAAFDSQESLSVVRRVLNFHLTNDRVFVLPLSPPELQCPVGKITNEQI